MPSSSRAGDRGPSRCRRPSDHGGAPLHPTHVASGRPARRECSTRTSPARSSPSAGCGGAWPAGSTPAAGAAWSSPGAGCGAARGRRAAHPPPSTCGIAHSISQVSVGWARPYHQTPKWLGYVSVHVSEFCFIYFFTDTSRIRIHHVSGAYPYRIRIRYGIRGQPHVSV
jgi:hypothetical protein